MFGWTAGAGLDYKWQIDPGSAVIFGVEYLHYGFGQHSVTFSTTSPGGFGFLGTPGNTFSMTTKDSVDVVKARISYLFSIH
jgi:opacity protein-like surface antigen